MYVSTACWCFYSFLGSRHFGSPAPAPAPAGVVASAKTAATGRIRIPTRNGRIRARTSNPTSCRYPKLAVKPQTRFDRGISSPFQTLDFKPDPQNLEVPARFENVELGTRFRRPRFKNVELKTLNFTLKTRPSGP